MAAFKIPAADESLGTLTALRPWSAHFPGSAEAREDHAKLSACRPDDRTFAGPAALLTGSAAFPARPEKRIEVSVEDIGTKVTLVGRLGQPLGTMMEVQGTWSYPRQRPGEPPVKDDSLRFRVSQVNGKKLPQPVEFNVAQIEAATRTGKNAIPKFEELKMLDGIAWTLQAYETGRFHHVPEDYWKKLGTAPPGPPSWPRIFTSELVGVVQK
jgi:hypothetical protein